ncbi:MAG: FeoB small GTPase domain-containing protein, partial [Acutalibacteraceae bacterium]
MSPVIALVGNPNCGKTTLFNELTGCDQSVGNWPGVTVEKKEGALKIAGRKATILDLPGIYSLYPYSAEERIARDVLFGDTVDVIVNVVDATNLERHLYLTMQLIELGRPMVVALNMADRVAASGVRLDIPALEKALGVPMTAVCAADGTGLRELVCRALDADAARLLSGAAPSFYDVSLTRTLERTERLIAPACHRRKQPLRASAIRLLDGDAQVSSVLRLSFEKQRQIEECFCTLPIEREERDTLVAREKYRFISRVCDD